MAIALERLTFLQKHQVRVMFSDPFQQQWPTILSIAGSVEHPSSAQILTENSDQHEGAPFSGMVV
ncbi:hypothetical protein [Streptacidiphilus sp. EB129]|uniref:hypothetical protein n=1 Tax=Streptacidiphilus sp. EB129 TaxID=3156262 RepID=UPI003515E229